MRKRAFGKHTGSTVGASRVANPEGRWPLSARRRTQRRGGGKRACRDLGGCLRTRGFPSASCCTVLGCGTGPVRGRFPSFVPFPEDGRTRSEVINSQGLQGLQGHSVSCRPGTCVWSLSKQAASRPFLAAETHQSLARGTERPAASLWARQPAKGGGAREGSWGSAWVPAPGDSRRPLSLAPQSRGRSRCWWPGIERGLCLRWEGLQLGRAGCGEGVSQPPPGASHSLAVGR